MRQFNSFLILLLTSVIAHSQSLTSVKNWSFQLSDINPQDIYQSNFDLLVLDYSRDGSEENKLAKSEVERMKVKPDNSRRIVLSYLSIGEAESYRYYWNRKWKANPPSWLGKENPDWDGNYKVHYWEKQWQEIIYGSSASYLDKIIEQGFDGVYLDIIDGFEYYEDSLANAKDLMAQFVNELSLYAKHKAGRDFYIFGQNGETLVDNDLYLSSIDGIGKEDLFFGIEEEEQANPEEEINFTLSYLEKAKRACKTILLVEYIHHHHDILKVINKCKEEGFIPLFANRELNVLTPDLHPHHSDPLQADSAMINRLTPGKFYSVVLPKGMFRIQTSSQYYTEKYSYSRPLNQDQDIDYFGRNYYEWTNGMSIYYGLGKHWETGIYVPIATSHLYSDQKDSLLNPAIPVNHTGLGCVELYLNHGNSWNNYKDNFMLEILVGLPTDTRNRTFNPGSYGRIAITREHYKKKTGLIGVLAGNYYTMRNYTGWFLTPEAGLGIGIQVTKSFFISAMLVQELLATRTEINVEKILSKRYSIEASLGKGLFYSYQTFYGSLALNFISKKKK